MQRSVILAVRKTFCSALHLQTMGFGSLYKLSSECYSDQRPLRGKNAELETLIEYQRNKYHLQGI